jgi:hypothetical protein
MNAVTLSGGPDKEPSFPMSRAELNSTHEYWYYVSSKLTLRQSETLSLLE